MFFFVGTLTTLKSEFDHQNMTPLDIAREHRFSSLYKILTPVIKHYIPPQDLVDLEKEFHKLLKDNRIDFTTYKLHGDLSNTNRLPPLPMLTELEFPQMWFPITGQKHEMACQSYKIVTMVY